MVWFRPTHNPSSLSAPARSPLTLMLMSFSVMSVTLLAAIFAAFAGTIPCCNKFQTPFQPPGWYYTNQYERTHRPFLVQADKGGAVFRTRGKVLVAERVLEHRGRNADTRMADTSQTRCSYSLTHESGSQQRRTFLELTKGLKRDSLTRASGWTKDKRAMPQAPTRREKAN